MEHLFFRPCHDSNEAASAYHAIVLKADWRQTDYLIDFVELRTEWLGFDHDVVDFEKFEDYPTNAGFDESKLWIARFREAHLSFKDLPSVEIGRRVAALFQSWLYFGLLECVIGKKIEVSYLARRDVDGREYLYSRNLHFCLQAKIWEIRVNRINMLSASKDIQHLLQLANTWILRFQIWSGDRFRPSLDKEYPGFVDRLEKIIPAIVRLAEAIEQWKTFALAVHKEGLAWNSTIDVIDKRMVKLRDLGWCSFQVKRLEDTLNQSTIDWLIASNIRQDPAGHDTCTEEACSRNDIDESTYQQAHICQGVQCQKLFPDLQTVMKILKEDKIPVMSLKTINEEPQIHVSARLKGITGDYFAISHVWSDGLGGKTEAGLNKCQAERLTKLCQSVYGSPENVYFWIDSLCIPRVDRDVYIKALVGIRDAYLCASSVLVLDKTIESCTLSSSTETLYAHIYLSAWMQRMWTYEEAVLAKVLIFVLGNGLHTYKIDTMPSVPQTVSVVWRSLGVEIFRLRVADGQGTVVGALNIGHIYNAFRYRLTNAPQEEFLSVSSMLDLDTESLLSVKGEERAKKFWLMLRWIPYNAPFADCPKLSVPGFRWAPRTMMSQTEYALNGTDGFQKSECTIDGLVGTYLTMLLGPPLKGSAENPGPPAMFLVLVNGSIDGVNPSLKFKRILRLACVGPWPSSPNSHDFDTIIFPGRAVDEGSWARGAAFSREILRSGSHSIPRFKYVGELAIEALKMKDVNMNTSSGNMKINASGIWGVREVCLR